MDVKYFYINYIQTAMSCPTKSNYTPLVQKHISTVLAYHSGIHTFVLYYPCHLGFRRLSFTKPNFPHHIIAQFICIIFLFQDGNPTTVLALQV